MRNRTVLIAVLSILSFIFMESCNDEQSLDYKRYYVNGKGLYEKNCQSCHGASGEGLGTLYPPLTDTTYLLSSRNQLACIIKTGQKGPISVNGKTYNEAMPGNPRLADIDVAQIIVYVTNSFGNKQGHFTLEEVSEGLKSCD